MIAVPQGMMGPADNRTHHALSQTRTDQSIEPLAEFLDATCGSGRAKPLAAPMRRAFGPGAEGPQLRTMTRASSASLSAGSSILTDR